MLCVLISTELWPQSCQGFLLQGIKCDGDGDSALQHKPRCTDVVAAPPPQPTEYFQFFQCTELFPAQASALPQPALASALASLTPALSLVHAFLAADLFPSPHSYLLVSVLVISKLDWPVGLGACGPAVWYALVFAEWLVLLLSV